ncbi:Threonine synthase [Pseudomonas orientalis]|nr:Threonine synthase [Pseudomonas orientalis]AZF01219.1 Threonine synthase [Pseudomonas orientalis]
MRALTAGTGPKCGRGLAPDGGLRADQDAGLDRVHIRFCGNGCLGFRSYSGSLLKSAKVSKTLLPHHSAPRLGSVCPLSGLNPWAAAMGHPWPSAANPASCRVTHEFKPAFGQRGLTGRLRSRSKATRCASWLVFGATEWTKCGRGLAPDSGGSAINVFTVTPSSGASRIVAPPLPHCSVARALEGMCSCIN